MEPKRDYWDKRSNLEYYKKVQELISRVEGQSIVDVGGWNTPVALSGDFSKRVVLNLWEVPQQERWDGIEYEVWRFHELDSF